MKTVNREVCPHCGQTINERKIQLSSTLVDALWKVYLYSIQENKKRFLREEIKHLFAGNETVTANFAYWKWFSSKGITGKKGEYILDWDVLDRFFSGKATVPAELWVKGTGKQQTRTPVGVITINKIPHIGTFFEGEDYIVRYGRKGSV